jgi:hypothetical protein
MDFDQGNNFEKARREIMWNPKEFTMQGGIDAVCLHREVGTRLLRDGGPIVWIEARWPKTGDTFKVFEIPRDIEGAICELEFNGAEVVSVTEA